MATGFFEISSLLALDGKWQQLDKIRILMGDQVSLKTKRAFRDALHSRIGHLDADLEDQKLTNRFRKASGKGKKSSPLDDIRPRTWTFTDELLRLITILQHTIDVTPAAAQLLDEIVNGPLLLATDLPQPTEAERKPPRV